ncbi:hypothetical protein [Undibacterium sp. TJN19]|uniref:hypothetical protein n=1 Tax=Undibacterium sp. TJN19 TaxID=3413055 RepID=UPI003BF33385
MKIVKLAPFPARFSVRFSAHFATLMLTQVLTLLLSMALSHNSQAQPTPPFGKKLPATAPALRDFVPRGWAVENQVSGDLNGDGQADIAAVVVQNKGAGDASGDDRQRGLIVLLASGKAYSLLGSNDKLLQCQGCGGVKDGVNVTIKNGVLVVSQYSGSREYSIYTWRFRLDASSQRLQMIGIDEEETDSMLGKGSTVSTNLLTGQQISETYQYNQKQERNIILTSKKSKVAKTPTLFEDAVGNQ